MNIDQSTLFEKLVYCIGRRTDDPLVIELLSKLKAQPFKAINPKYTSSDSIAIKEIGIDELSYSCSPHVRNLWPPKKENNKFISYVTAIQLSETFKPLPSELSWGLSKNEIIDSFQTETIGLLKRIRYFKLINESTKLIVNFEDEKLISVKLILIEERTYITSDEESEKLNPLVYVEDAFFAVWCALNNCLDPQKYTAAVLEPLKNKNISPLEFLNKTCQRVLWESDFDYKKCESLLNYYSAFGEYVDPNNYRSDIKKCFKDSNHFKDKESEMTPDNFLAYEKIAALISQRFPSAKL